MEAVGESASRFREVNHERSAKLYQLFVTYILPTFETGAAAAPPPLFLVTEDEDSFREALVSSSLFVRLANQVALAHSFARGVTGGLGGDAFQRFVANHRPPKGTACSLEALKELFSKTMALEFSALMLPMYCNRSEGRAVLLFRWDEHDIAMPGAEGLLAFYVGVVVAIANAAKALADVRAELHSDSPVPQCELLPGRWLLPPNGSDRAAKSADDVGAEMALTFETVRDLGKHAHFHYLGMCIMDSRLLYK